MSEHETQQALDPNIHNEILKYWTFDDFVRFADYSERDSPITSVFKKYNLVLLSQEEHQNLLSQSEKEFALTTQTNREGNNVPPIEFAENMTFTEFRDKVENTSNVNTLLKAKEIVKGLENLIQTKLKITANIKTDATVSFNEVTSEYKKADGSLQHYTHLKATWREKGKLHGKSIKSGEDKTRDR